jgi:hypothetical protein
LLSASGGLVLLAGEPRAVSNAAIIVLIYACAVVRSAGGRRMLLGSLALAAVAALSLGAVQLLPGLAFLHASQRGSSGYAFFAFGSLPLRLLPLQAVPYLLGGFSQLNLLPDYAGTYNLPEVTGYVGLLALVALISIPFWRQAKYTRLNAWLVMVLVGLILALGGETPLGHLLARVPLYGSQRLQSRNLAILDLGLAGTLACWLDAVVTAPQRGVVRARAQLERAVSLVPVVVVVSVVAVAVVWGDALQRFLHVPRVRPHLFADEWWYLVAAIVLAGSVALFVVVHRSLSPRYRAWALITIFLFDLGLTLVNQDASPVPTGELVDSPRVAGRLAAALRPAGRFAVYDPESRVSTMHHYLARALSPDATILHDLSTVQGYGSIVDAGYQALTKSHNRLLIAPQALAGTTADVLNLRLVLVRFSYLTSSSSAGSSPLPPRPRVQAALEEPHWRSDGRYGPFAAFINTRALGRVWVATRVEPTQPAAGAEVRVVTTGTEDDETDVVRSTTAGMLVRSVVWSNGWIATVHMPDGSSRSVPARRLGVVQGVRIPAGSTRVTWSYKPSDVRWTFRLSVLATFFLVALVSVSSASSLLARRRERAVAQGRLASGATRRSAQPPGDVPPSQRVRSGSS